MRKLFIIALTSFLVSCGGGGSDSSDDSQFSNSCSLRITNGSECSTGSGPIALLELVDGNQNLLGTCTGAFISTQHALTGAHCFDGGVSAAIVRVSDKRIASQSISRPASYTPTNSVSAFDFAVVTLSEAAQDVETLPILVSEPASLGMLVNIVGYGQDENGNSALQGNEYENSLKKGTMIISDLDSSLRAFAAEFNETQQSICSGDSGGPAIVVNRDGIAGIIGVAQAVTNPTDSEPPTCLTDTIAVFTDVQSQSNLDFILALVPGVGKI